MSITNALLKNLPQRRDNFLKWKKKYYISRSFFYAILCDQKLGISVLSILIMSTGSGQWHQYQISNAKKIKIKIILNQ